MERLRHTRELAGLSQQELANKTGVSQHTISQIELGQRKPQGRTLRKLAKALGVEVADLFGDWREAFDTRGLFGRTLKSASKSALSCGKRQERKGPAMQDAESFLTR